MKPPRLLITADLHLTDRPQDNYRWGFLPWLGRQAKQNQVDAVYVLGDLTDAKDEHGSALVNRLIAALTKLAKIAPVVVLKGNHDYVDAARPYFGFLSKIPNLTFITEPRAYPHGGALDVLCLPHCADPATAWSQVDFAGRDLVFIHQSVEGAVGQNGARLGGIRPAIFAGMKPDGRVIAGDVHVPQTIGGITYAGAPYPIHFGDAYAPRVLLYDVDVALPFASVPVPGPRKILAKISRPAELEKVRAAPGDMLKVVFALDRAAYPLYNDYKAEVAAHAAKHGLTLAGVALKGTERPSTAVPSPSPGKAGPKALFACYAARNAIEGRLVQVGESFLEPLPETSR